MPMQDGPRYHPGVCILSLGAPCVLRFYRKMTEGEPCALWASQCNSRGGITIYPHVKARTVRNACAVR